MDDKLLQIFKIFNIDTEDHRFIKYETPVEIDVVFQNGNQHVFSISGVIGLFSLDDNGSAFVVIKTDSTFALARDVVFLDVRN